MSFLCSTELKGKFFSLGLTVCLSFPGAFAAPVDLSPPKAAIGSADEDGYLLMIQSLGSIDFGNGMELPFRLDFNSSKAGGESAFGWKGWNCGVLESSAEFISGIDYLRVELLCAKVLMLKRDDGAVTYTSLDKKWKGIAGAGKVRVFREDGWELRFEKNRISGLTTDSGRIFQWSRDEAGKLLAIVEEGSAKKHLQVNWNGDQIGSIQAGGENTYEFSFQNGFLSTVDWDLKTPTPKNLSLAQNGNSLIVERGHLPPRIFEWDEKTGLLTADNSGSYQLRKEPHESSGEVKRFVTVIEMERSDGARIEFRKDRTNGKSTKTLPDGAGDIVTRRLTRSGPMFNLLGRIDLERKDQDTVILMQNFFGKKGRIVKRLWRGNPRSFDDYNHGGIEEVFLAMPQTLYPAKRLPGIADEKLYEITYGYRSDGRLREVKVDGEKVLVRSYDDRGRLISQSVTNRFSETFHYREDGSVQKEVEISSGHLNHLDAVAPVATILDSKKRRLTETLADGRTKKFHYDESDRVVSVESIAPDNKTVLSVKSLVYKNDGSMRYEHIKDFLLEKEIHRDFTLDSRGIVVAQRTLVEAPEWVSQEQDNPASEQ